MVTAQVCRGRGGIVLSAGRWRGRCRPWPRRAHRATRELSHDAGLGRHAAAGIRGDADRSCPGPFPLLVMPSSWGLADFEYVGAAAQLDTIRATWSSAIPRGGWVDSADD